MFTGSIEIYAQVTAGAVIGPQWQVIIDTLALPDETLQCGHSSKISDRPGALRDQHHYHADHSWGAAFSQCTVIALICALK